MKMNLPYPSAVIAALVCLSLPAWAAADPFGQIRVSAEPSRYVGPCPAHIAFTGSVELYSPPEGFTFNYHWERSDGARGPLRVVRVRPDQRFMHFRETWDLGAPGANYDLYETLLVASGNTHLSYRSPVVRVSCR